MVVTIALVVADLLLFAFAVSRPWRALPILLGFLPLNAFLIYIPVGLFSLNDVTRVALAGWHDAIGLGIVAAAGLAYWRGLRQGRPFRIGLVDLLVAAVLALGVVYIFVAEYRLTAVYAYRTLYEPIALLLALTILARTEGVPDWAPRWAALAMLVGGTVAALAVWPQVYLGGFGYLDRFYHAPGETLSPSYIATAIHQARGVGTFNSPNEFGAYLAVMVALLVVPGVIRIRPVLRTSLLVIVALALLLSFSRSGTLSAAAIVAVTAFLTRSEWPSMAEIRARLANGQVLLRHGTPVLIGLGLVTVVVLSSGAPQFAASTVTGGDPSADYRATSVSVGLHTLEAGPLGLGLGMAGPKSTRFGEVGPVPVAASEVWYVTYAMQVGVIGFAVFAALVLAILRRLVKARSLVWPRLAIAVGVGLGLGALFIPILDDPSVAVPLWVTAGLGLGLAGLAPPDLLTRRGVAEEGAKGGDATL
jgi:hypothetical protein